SRIFFRNAINQGLALVQSKEAYDLIEGGEMITINYASGEILTEGRKIPFPPLPEIVMGILEDGGLIEHLKKNLKK
ncbi:MAG: 3-isopropylmalate dehydratase, partial [candidate division Zixibacteria bacterium]|nr:3-isopropylmalate dehydratase [candidate division Zixibacteria bacterium]